MTIQEFYDEWEYLLGTDYIRQEFAADLRSLIRYYGGEPGKDTLTRTEKAT